MPSDTAQKTALLLIAHGSRRKNANADLTRLAAMIADRKTFPIVETAYLELAEPDIPTGVQRCIQRGAKSVRMLPYFLSAGVHISEDLTGYRDRFTQEHSGVSFTLCPPLGLHDGIVDVLLSRAEEVFGQ